MKAIVQDRYGAPDEVLRLDDIDVPVPAAGEVLVCVRATTVHPDVWHVVTGRPYVLRLMGAGVRRPKNPIPGTDVAGIVEAVGSDVTRFAPGDEVFGESHLEMQWRNGGAFAEYVAAPEDALARKPANVSFEQAATVPTSGYIAVHNLDFGKRIRAGDLVLINGAAGGVGSIAVQLAKAWGAHVTGVDGPDKLDLLRTLGADEVVDYTGEDVTRRGERYDLVFDVASNITLARSKRLLTRGGSFVLIGHDHYGDAAGRVFGSIPRFLGLMAITPLVRRLPQVQLATPPKKDVIPLLAELLGAGKLTPVIDRTFPIAETAAAMRYLQEGRARGRIVIVP